MVADELPGLVAGHRRIMESAAAGAKGGTLKAHVPLISVLAPCYNHDRFITEAISSVRQQTWEEWELIIIDDGSRDGSVQAAIQAAQGDPRIQVLANEKNLGTYGTEQRALELAKGSLIAILNTDDLWAPDKLERQASLLDRLPQASFCYTLGHVINQEGAVRPDDVHAGWPRTECHDLLPWLLSENRVLASSVLFRREGLSFDRTCRTSGDWVALVEASLRGMAACIPDPLTLWRVHDSNAHFFSEPRILEEIRVLEAIRANWGMWAEGRDRALFEAHQGRSAMNLLAWYLVLGLKARAAGLAGDVMKFRPRTTALKRLAGVAVSRRRAIGRLFPDAADEMLGFDLKRMRQQAKAQLPLIFFGGSPVEPPQ